MFDMEYIFKVSLIMDLNLEMIRKGIYGRLNPPEKKSCCNTNQNEKIAKKIAISVVIVTNQPIRVLFL